MVTAFLTLIILFPFFVCMLISIILRSWTLFYLAVADFVLQFSVWAVSSFILKCGEKFYDLTGSIAFILITSLSYYVFGAQVATRQFLGTYAVMIWALRLGSFLFRRIVSSGGRDRRFDNVRAVPSKIAMYWSLQGLWVFITALPVIHVNTLDSVPIHSSLGLGLFDIFGFGLWIAGFLTETIADYQKSVFRAQRKNHDKFITTGLWSISRHPNYFGEIVLWFGLFVSMSNAFSTLNEYFLMILSPFLVATLLTHVSGIPLLEKHAEEKWGKLPEYQEYKKKTPLIIPEFLMKPLPEMPPENNANNSDNNANAGAASANGASGEQKKSQ
jgi:steroid 5-alpha reductase family enzyme